MSAPGIKHRPGVSVVRCSGDVKCRHQGFHTITSSYDRETRVITYFRRCDECGALLSEFGRLAYEPRFVATRGDEPWTPAWSSERPAKIFPDPVSIERPQGLARRASAGGGEEAGLDF